MKRTLHRAPTIAVMVLVGMLLAITAVTASGTSLRSETADVADIVRNTNRDVAGLQRDIEKLTADIDNLGDTGTTAVSEPLLRSDDIARRPISGEGVVVTLDDASATAIVPDGMTANDLIVHQQDVDGVVNALWSGGAEAITVAGERLGPGSAVRCVGNTVRVNGRVFAPPYEIAAVGSSAKLQAALDAAPAVKTYQDYADTVGLGYKVRTPKNLDLPAFVGPVRPQYAHRSIS